MSIMPVGISHANRTEDTYSKLPQNTQVRSVQEINSREVRNSIPRSLIVRTDVFKNEKTEQTPINQRAQVSCSTGLISTKLPSLDSKTQKQNHDLVGNWKKQFDVFENNGHSKPYGYRVSAGEDKNGALTKTAEIAHGSRPFTSSLQELTQPAGNECVFCCHASNLPTQMHELNSRFYTAISNSGKVLLNPKAHSSHYFKMSEEDQLEAWNLVARLRLFAKQHPHLFSVTDSAHSNIVFSQEVPHTHFHTGICPLNEEAKQMIQTLRP
jgi:diadenosine tetraphosphate (Ap4A) HIT family hydrolase